MGIVAVAASHRAFHNLVMKWLCEVRFHLVVTTHAELWLTQLQHVKSREARLFGVCRPDKRNRFRDVAISREQVW